MISMIFGSKMFRLSDRVIVHGKGNLGEFESVGWNVVRRRFLLLFVRFLEGTDVLGTLDLDREDVTRIIAQNQAIELECERHAASM